jgi:hypothetical protein
MSNIQYLTKVVGALLSTVTLENVNGVYITIEELSDYRGRVYERNCHTTWCRERHVENKSKYLAQGYTA